MVKPQFVSEIKEWNKTIVKWKRKSLTHRYRNTFKIESSFKNVVKEGQVKTLLKGLSMAGKQGQHK
jgi:cell division protein FtsI (penicillin-binding protein 3)